MKPQPPCTRDCPRRSILPNCHSVDFCPDWAEYLESMRAWADMRGKALRADADVSSARRLLEANKMREMKRGGK